MKKIFAVAACAALAGGLFAAEVLQPRKVADFSGYLKSAKDIENGIRITTPKMSIRFETRKQIPIDTKKKYMISCEYRLTPGKKTEGRFYFAPVCYDKNGKEIRSAYVICVNGSDTVLAAAAKKGDKVVKIKNGAKWILKHGKIAFNSKKDYSDLPNSDIAPLAAIKKNGDLWELTLQTPLAKDYPAGTAVREQCDGASYRYALGYVAPKAEWVKYSGILSGEMRENAPNYGKCWRPGTKKAGIIIFSDGQKALDMEFRNISISEVK